MALSDTARLIASLELEDKFSKTADKYNKALSGMERKTSTLEKVGFQVGRGARNAIDNIGRIAVVGAGLVASQVALGVKSLAELAEVENQTAAVLESTGNAANVTAEHIRTQAEALEDLSTVDDKVIQAGENMLLTFKNIRNEVGEGNDIFDQATQTLIDMSTALGTEPKQAAIQLGKALNDPVKGITALTRVGVTFSEQQKKQIERFVETNRVAEAQKVILQELQSEFGGSAAAFGKGPGADMRRFGDAIEGAQQALATGFLPVMERVTKLVQEGLANPEVQANIKEFGKGLASGVEDLISIGLKLPWDAIGNAAVLMGKGAKALLDAFTGLPPWIQTAVLTGWGLNKLTGGALGNIAATLTGSLAKGVFSRGGTPATPLFTKEVGIPGVGGPGAPGGGTGIWKIAGGVFALSAAAIIAAEVGSEMGKQTKAAKDQFNASGGGFLGLEGFFRDLFGKTRPQGAATPIGQFNTANAGGVQQVKIVNSNLFDKTGDSIDRLTDQAVNALEKGDIHAARIASNQADNLRQLIGAVNHNTNTVIPHLGRTNRALSTANRNLQDGNARQREVIAGVQAARSSIGTGFQATNANLSTSNSRLATIAAKDFSPKISVTVPVTNNVSISEVTRTATSYAFSTGSGFTSGGNSNTP